MAARRRDGTDQRLPLPSRPDAAAGAPGRGRSCPAICGRTIRADPGYNQRSARAARFQPRGAAPRRSALRSCAGHRLEPAPKRGPAAARRSSCTAGAGRARRRRAAWRWRRGICCGSCGGWCPARRWWCPDSAVAAWVGSLTRSDRAGGCAPGPPASTSGKKKAGSWLRSPQARGRSPRACGCHGRAMPPAGGHWVSEGFIRKPRLETRSVSSRARAGRRRSPSRRGHGWRRRESPPRNRRSSPSTGRSGRCARRWRRAGRNAGRRLVDRRDAHQPLVTGRSSSRAVSISASVSARGDAGLLPLLAGIDLDEERRAAAELLRQPGEGLGQLRPVERVDGVEQASSPGGPCWSAGGRSDATRRPR